MMRCLLALHATVPAAVVAAMLLHLWPPAGLPPLAGRPGWANWALIGMWLSFSMAVLPLHGAMLWRVALAAAGVLLAVAGVSGVVLGTPLAIVMGISLALVGAVCAAAAACIGPARVQATTRAKVPPDVAQPITVARRRSAHTVRAWRLWLAAQAGYASFWLAGGLAVESFRLAHLVATAAVRPSGMVGLLLACLVALPAATLNTWLPRTSAALWMLATLGYAGLAVKSGLLQWAVASALCALAACGWRWVRRPPWTRRHGASTGAST